MFLLSLQTGVLFVAMYLFYLFFNDQSLTHPPVQFRPPRFGNNKLDYVLMSVQKAGQHGIVETGQTSQTSWCLACRGRQKWLQKNEKGLRGENIDWVSLQTCCF